MNPITYRRKCRALFKKAKKLNVELIFNPNRFDPQRLNCIWYGGWLATIRVSDLMSIELNIHGDVIATLTDEAGYEIVCVKDKNNSGTFGKEIRPYLESDEALRMAIEEGELHVDYGNWIEYDGEIKRNDIPEADLEFIDLGIVCDNLLDDDILIAIRQALDSLEDIKK